MSVGIESYARTGVDPLPYTDYGTSNFLPIGNMVDANVERYMKEGVAATEVVRKKRFESMPGSVDRATGLDKAPQSYFSTNEVEKRRGKFGAPPNTRPFVLVNRSTKQLLVYNSSQVKNPRLFVSMQPWLVYQQHLQMLIKNNPQGDAAQLFDTVTINSDKKYKASFRLDGGPEDFRLHAMAGGKHRYIITSSNVPVTIRYASVLSKTPYSSLARLTPIFKKVVGSLNSVTFNGWGIEYTASRHKKILVVESNAVNEKPPRYIIAKGVDTDIAIWDVVFLDDYTHAPYSGFYGGGGGGVEETYDISDVKGAYITDEDGTLITGPADEEPADEEPAAEEPADEEPATPDPLNPTTIAAIGGALCSGGCGTTVCIILIIVLTALLCAVCSTLGIKNTESHMSDIERHQRQKTQKTQQNTVPPSKYNTHTRLGAVPAHRITTI